MAHLDQTIRHTKRALDALVGPKIVLALPAHQSADASPVAAEPGHQDDRTEHDV